MRLIGLVFVPSWLPLWTIPTSIGAQPAEKVARDYEGVVAKDDASLYEAGPTRHWLKVKQTGWTIDEDRWQRRISAGA